MSADLFAAFGDTPQQSTSSPQQTQATQDAPTSDPFSFLGFDSSTAQPQKPQHFTQQPLFQQPTTSQPNSWLVSQVNEPQQSSGWGDIGSLGGFGGLQSPPSTLSVVQKPTQTEEDDDGWGDFEVAPTSPPPQPTFSRADNPRSRVTRASTLDMLSNKLVDLGLESSAPEPWQQRPSWETEAKAQKPPKPVHNPDPNVLFDADFEAENELDEDDDFGDFETGDTVTTSQAPPAAPAATTTSALDLLSLNAAPAPAPAPPKKQPPGLVLSKAALNNSPASYPQAPKSPYGSFQERKPEPAKQLQVKPPAGTKVLSDANTASPSPITAWPSVEHDGFGNDWEEFKDLPDTKPTPATKSTLKPKPNPKPAPASSSDWEWQDWGGTDEKPSSTNTQPSSQPQTPSPTTSNPGPPPTNIPPPAILLSLFPQLLDLASASLLKPLLTLSSSSPAYQRVLAAEPTLTFLRGYLALAAVASRLIAGRKHRWHRDKFLAQGMSISAAPVGKGGGGARGMKLANIDKSQSAREDREAAEVADAWKRQVGRLRGVVAGVNASHPGEIQLRVPEVAVGLAVTTAKNVPTAPRACVVCGLKRDERVARVDVEVEDSFGEWWVEHWGHRECRNFWVRHEKELRSR